MKEGCRSPLVADLRVVFIDISGDVAEYAYMHTSPECVCMCWYVCVCVLVKLLGLEGRAIRVDWLVHGTEGDRYELQPLVRAPSSCPRAYLSPSSFLLFCISPLLIIFLLLFRPYCHFAFSLRRALSSFLRDFRHDFVSIDCYYYLE